MHQEFFFSFFLLVKKVLKPVRGGSLDVGQRWSTIRSSMFLKAMYLRDGTFDKLKVRLVAGGDQQDKSPYNGVH
jgi:hypothetical protein